MRTTTFIKVSDAKNKDDVTKDKEKYENDLEAVKSKYYSTKNKLFARLVAYDTVNSEGMGNRFAGGTIDTIAGALTGDSISQGLKNLGKVGGAIGDLFLNTWELNVVTNNEDLDEIYEMVKKKYANDPEALKLAEELRTIGREFHSLERKIDALDNISETDGPIYEYITPNGESILFKKVNYSFQSAGEAALGKYETIDASNSEGCMPLPAKLAETRSCIFCPLFLTIFNAAQTMTTNSFGVLGPEIAKVIFIGLALYIAFLVLKYVSSMTKQDTPRFMNELLTQCFKVVVACVLLYTPDFVYSKIIGPVLDAGTELGGALLFEEGSGYTQWCSIEQNITDQTNEFIKGGEDGTETPLKEGLIPAYIYTKIECFIRAVQAEISLSQSIGSSLMCISRNAAADSVTSVPIPDFTMMFQGLIIWLMAIIMTIAFAFYLIDATVKLGIVGALMPFLIACWPFKITSKYTSQGFTMFMNTFFTYVFMGLVVSINIQLISVSMTGVQGGKDAIIAALNGNKVQVLKDLLDIGFAGFLILIASSIFGFKLCGQAAELAGSMAGGGGGSSIAPEIGGMGYNVAKSAALGTGQKILGGAKFVGEATGVNEKLRKTRDSAVNKLVVSPLAKVFSFGRSGGGASSKTASPSQAPKPQSAPTSSTGSSGSSSVTPDQIRQADNLSNAAPRPTSTAQTTRGASGRAASTQTNNTPNNQASPSDANMDSMTPEQQREQRIDQFNQSHAASLDLERNSELYRQISDQCTQATSNRDAAVQRARSFEAQAKEEMDKATSLREKAQKLADGAEKDALLQQANTSEKNATDFSVQASEERNKEKENDDIVRETLQKMKEMQSDREKTMSKEDVDNVMKQAYGENYRADQTANRNGWNF